MVYGIHIYNHTTHHTLTPPSKPGQQLPIQHLCARTHSLAPHTHTVTHTHSHTHHTQTHTAIGTWPAAPHPAPARVHTLTHTTTFSHPLSLTHSLSLTHTHAKPLSTIASSSPRQAHARVHARCHALSLCLGFRISGLGFRRAHTR